MKGRQIRRILFNILVSITTIIVFGGLLLWSAAKIHRIQHPECYSTNPELLHRIAEYGKEIGVNVGDLDTCVYACRQLKKVENFSDNCYDVCIPSWCF